MAAESDAAPTQTRPQWPAVGYILAAAVIVVDQITKQIMLGVFGPGALAEACRRFGEGCGHVEISPLFDLTMVWNRGVSFGLFPAESGVGRWGLVIFSAVVALLLVHLLRRTRQPLTALAFGLVIGGAVGNMIDRARFGAVVDFINFEGPWFGWRIGDWPVGFPWIFNVADAAITIGACLIVLELLLDRRKAAH